MVSKESFLAGSQTGIEDNTGWTANNKIRNFRTESLKFSLDKNMKIEIKDNINKTILAVW